MGPIASLTSFRQRLGFPAIPLEKSIWVLVDQGTVSVGSFVTGIVLARQLAPSEYGLFALIVGLLLAANTAQAAVIGYPLMVRGGAVDEVTFRRLAITALALGAALAAVLCLAIGMGIWLFEARVGLAIGAAFALFAWQMQQGTRTALLARQRYQGAFPGDLLSYCGQAITIWGVVRGFHPPLAVVFFIIGLTSLLSCGLQIAQLRLHTLALSLDHFFLRETWLLGRWMFLTSVVGTLTLQFLVWGLTISHGSAQFAKYQALFNILGLTHPLLLSLDNFILPAVALANASSGMKRALRVSFVRAVPTAMLMIPLLIGLFVAGDKVLAEVYGADSPYRALLVPLRWMIVAYAFQLLVKVFTSFLNGIERPRATFVSSLAAAGVAGFFGAPLAVRFGVNGATTGFALVFLVQAVATGAFVFRIVQRNPDPRFVTEQPLTKHA